MLVGITKKLVQCNVISETDSVTIQEGIKYSHMYLRSHYPFHIKRHDPIAEHW